MSDYEKSEGGSNRRIEIMKAALPYLGYQAQRSLKVVVQVEELLDCLGGRDDDLAELSACGLNGGSVDMEAMLLSIRELCTAKEKEMINTLLNFIQAFKMIQNYNSFMASRSPSSESEGGEEGNAMMDFLMSQLPPEQKDNFENIRMMMSVMNMN